MDRIQSRALKHIGHDMVASSIMFLGHRRNVNCIVQKYLTQNVLPPETIAFGQWLYMRIRDSTDLNPWKSSSEPTCTRNWVLNLEFGICKSLYIFSFLIYHGARVMVLRSFDCTLWMSSMFVLLVYPYNWIPYVHIGFKILLYIVTLCYTLLREGILVLSIRL